MSRIAILSFFSGITERGVETYVYEIGSRLAKKHRVTVFQAGNPTPFQKFATRQVKFFGSAPKSGQGFLGKLYINWQSIKILGFSLRAIPKFLKGKYQIVFITNGGWQTVVYRIFTKITGAKIIIPGEAGIGADDAWNILFRPDAFIALTNSQAAWAKKLQPEVRVEKIPNGVDLSRFHSKIPAKDINLPKPIVICTSALVPYKRVEATIKAVAKTKLSLLVLGDGELRGQIDTIGKRYLGLRYKRKVVPYKDIPGYYKAGKVFTLASKTEAFGTSYIEAMACNLPVVTTSDDSRAEIIADAGILTDPENINQYARDLEIAAKTDYKNKPYSQSTNFSWNKIAEKYILLIEDLLKKKHR
ncbi:MAG TPA: glycosyltransferase family 4 protein [Candidatus Saccharimonadales bacterium]|nr:glycosyltransferase family 4 protein [Candidatus Saccharimonadales bacterium]